MSELILPGHIAAEKKAKVITEEDLAKEEAEIEKKLSEILPNPTGYKILIGVPKAADTFESGIAKADTTKHIEEVANVIAYVIKLGPDAYKDTAKFPSGPYCAEGDFIILRAYSGTRIKVGGDEYRLINDDSVEAVVLNPRNITRV